jgi:hypothetical protein
MANKRGKLSDLMNSAPLDRAADLRDLAPSAPPPARASKPTATKREREYVDRRGQTISPNIDHPTYELLQAYRNANSCGAVEVLSEALADESVVEALQSAWPNSAGIPGIPAKRTRRRSPDHKTHQVYLELGLQGRDYVEQAARDAGAPSLSAFVSKALNLYLESRVDHDPIEPF